MGKRSTITHYAVRAGRVPGINRTWEECEMQTNGYSGANCRGFQIEEGGAETHVVHGRKTAVEFRLNIVITEKKYLRPARRRQNNTP
jgi:viroplasmin and RNaseH domain-containing protein